NAQTISHQKPPRQNAELHHHHRDNRIAQQTPAGLPDSRRLPHPPDLKPRPPHPPHDTQDQAAHSPEDTSHALPGIPLHHKHKKSPAVPSARTQRKYSSNP